MGMKIALFVPSLSGGGAERAAVYIANHLAQKGEQIQFVAANAAGPFKSEIAADVELYDFKCERINRTFPKLVAYLRQQKPDVMLSFQAHANILALLVKPFAGATKFIVREGNTASTSLKKSELFRNRILYRLIPWLYPWADGIVAISQGVKDDLALILPAENISVIYNPAVPADIAQLAAEPVDHPFFAPDQPAVILSVGRLTKQKDHQTLLRAFVKLRQKIETHLLILGEGDQRQNLEKFIAENGLTDVVSMPGFEANPYAYMARSVVFALSSVWEGFGIVLTEALACGVPVVSTDCPSGPAEILDDGKYGTLVPMGDVDALAAALLEAIQTPQNSKIGMERAKQFSVATGVNKYFDLFENLVDSTGKRSNY